MTQHEWNMALMKLRLEGCKPTKKAEAMILEIDREHSRLHELVQRFQEAIDAAPYNSGEDEANEWYQQYARPLRSGRP